jgi:hypothetical protein
MSLDNERSEVRMQAPSVTNTASSCPFGCAPFAMDQQGKSDENARAE